MWVAIYWIMKIFAWAGLLFSIFSVFNPNLMLKFFVRSVQWKLKWLGLEGQIRPAANAEKMTRLWSAVLAAMFGVLAYIFTYIFFIGYALK